MFVQRLRKILRSARSIIDGYPEAESGGEKRPAIKELEVAPIFVIGANRSGTSFCAFILSQHPKIEALTTSFTKPTLDPKGYSVGYCESNHIWQSLLRSDFDITKGDAVMWGLPPHISMIYTREVSNEKRGQLIDELENARQTDKIPLIKMPHNILRIPLIKSLFPHCRFIYIARNYESYIEGCMHRYTVDTNAERKIDYPHIGLHWLILNTIALYDLGKYAPKDFLYVQLGELQAEQQTRQKTVDRIFRFLDLEPIDLDTGLFDDKFIHTHSGSNGELELLRELVQKVLSFEKGLLQKDREP